MIADECFRAFIVQTHFSVSFINFYLAVIQIGESIKGKEEEFILYGN